MVASLSRMVLGGGKESEEVGAGPQLALLALSYGAGTRTNAHEIMTARKG